MLPSEKWYAIWGIVYPDVPTPGLPNINMEGLDRPIQSLASICDRGSYALVEELGKSGLPLATFNIDDKRAIRAAMSRDLTNFLQEFLFKLEKPIAKNNLPTSIPKS